MAAEEMDDPFWGKRRDRSGEGKKRVQLLCAVCGELGCGFYPLVRLVVFKV
jgi:hypothetical protein